VVGSRGASAERTSTLAEAQHDAVVVGVCQSAESAMRMIRDLLPDVAIVDADLPGGVGMRIVRQIMHEQPLPVVMTTAAGPAQGGLAREAREAGAALLVALPRSTAPLPWPDLARAVRTMAGLKVVRRRERASEPVRPRTPVRGDVGLVVIGSSTGGPQALKVVFGLLPREFPVPIAVVQHMTRGFLDGMVSWLRTGRTIDVRVASQGEQLRPGTAYFAPDDVQMAVARDGLVVLRSDPPEAGLRPAVEYLFRSTASMWGRHAVGVLLTGMGSDGAVGLKAMRDEGAVTIVQDEASSVVFGMGAQAIKLRAAQRVLPLDDIAPVLRGLVAGARAEGRS